MRYGMYDSFLSSDQGGSFAQPSPLADTHDAAPAPATFMKTGGGKDAMDVEMEDITAKLQSFPTPMPPGAYPKSMANVFPAIATPATPPGPRGSPKKPRNPTPSSATFMFGRSAPYRWSPTDGVKYDTSPPPEAQGAAGHGGRKPETPTKEEQSRHRPQTKARPSAYAPPKPTPRPNPSPFPPQAHYRAAPPRPKFGLFDGADANEHTPLPNRFFGDRYAKHASPFGHRPGAFDDQQNRASQAQARKQTRHTQFDRKMNMAGLGSDPRRTSLPKVNPDKSKTSTRPRKPVNPLPNFPPRQPFGHAAFGGFKPAGYGAAPQPSPFTNYTPAGGFAWASPLRPTALPKPFVPPVPVFSPPVVQAWAKYERRWDAIKAGSPTIRLSMIPWPIEKHVASAFAPFASEVTPKAIGDFIFSRLHSVEMSRKKRVQNALRNYHPDKFAKVLEGMDRESEKEMARNACDVVVRILNEMLATEV